MYKDNAKADTEKTDSFIVRIWKSSNIFESKLLEVATRLFG
jgi:hypothetical protein